MAEDLNSFVHPDSVDSIQKAAHDGNVEKLSELIQAGKITYNEDNRGWKPLHYAVNAGHLKCVELLLKQELCNVDWKTFDGRTPLLMACRKLKQCPSCAGTLGDHKAIIDLLLQNGADPNIYNDSGAVPLFFAARYGTLEIVQGLVNAGANVKYISKVDSCNVLHAMVLPGNLSQIRNDDREPDPAFFEEGYNMFYERHPMQENKEAVPILSYLLEKGADPFSEFVNLQSGSDVTELLDFTVHREVFELIPEDIDNISRLATFLFKFTWIKSERILPIHFAILSQQTAFIKTLLEHLKSPLKRKEMIHSTITKGCDAFNVAMITALFTGEFDVPKLLLDFGANPNSVYLDIHPLNLVCYASSAKEVEFLKNEMIPKLNPKLVPRKFVSSDRHKDIWIPTRIKASPFSSAMCMKNKSSWKILTVLLNGDTDLNPGDFYVDYMYLYGRGNYDIRTHHINMCDKIAPFAQFIKECCFYFRCGS